MGPLPALLCLFAALLVTNTGRAATINFTDLQLNGDASLVNSGDTLRLVPNTGSSHGTAFIEKPFYIKSNASFSSFFQFRISPEGADGLAFVVHNDVRGSEALGPQGISMGYGVPADPFYPGTEISPSVVVEFDTYYNGGFPVDDPDDNHIGVNINGSLKSEVTHSPVFRLEGDSRFAWIDYLDGNLSVYLSEDKTKPTSPSISHNIDIAGIVGSKAYFGFSSGTGSEFSNHDIEAWDFKGPAPVPLPSSLSLSFSILAGLMAICLFRQEAFFLRLF